MIKTYYEVLTETLIKEDLGIFKDVLKHLPQMFNQLQNIYVDENATWEIKLLINSCFSYLAIPNDLYPDGQGPEGYLDDFYVCFYVLKEIINENPSIMTKNWTIELTPKDFFSLIENEIENKNIFHKLNTEELLNFTGISRIEYMAEEFKFLKLPKNENEKLQRIEDENIELMSLLKTLLIAKGYPATKFKKLKDYKSIYSEDEWKQVMTILELVNIHEKGYDTHHEDEIKKIKQQIQQQINKRMFDEM